MKLYENEQSSLTKHFLAQIGHVGRKIIFNVLRI